MQSKEIKLYRVNEDVGNTWKLIYHGANRQEAERIAKECCSAIEVFEAVWNEITHENVPGDRLELGFAHKGKITWEPIF